MDIVEHLRLKYDQTGLPLYLHAAEEIESLRGLTEEYRQRLVELEKDAWKAYTHNG
jgi:hypothetical protein